MPRRDRCVLPQIPCHITQRGVDRSVTFRDADDRHTYLGLLRENLSDAAVRILGYCLVSVTGYVSSKVNRHTSKGNV